MFGFEKLEVYNLAHRQYVRLSEVLATFPIDQKNQFIIDALRKSTFDCLIHFTEGSSVMEVGEKQKFYTKSRTSVFNSVASLKLLFDLKGIDESAYQELYATYESLSRMMLSLIKNMSVPGGGLNSNGKSMSGGGNNGKKRQDYPNRSNNKSSDNQNSHLDDPLFDIGEDDQYDDFNKLTIGE